MSRVTKSSVEIAAPRRKRRPGRTKSLGVFVAGRDVVLGHKVERTEIVSDAELSRKLAWRQGQLIYSRPASGRRHQPDIGRYSGHRDRTRRSRA